jgi:hypothetical protein
MTVLVAQDMRLSHADNKLIFVMYTNNIHRGPNVSATYDLFTMIMRQKHFAFTYLFYNLIPLVLLGMFKCNG